MPAYAAINTLCSLQDIIPLKPGQAVDATPGNHSWQRINLITHLVTALFPWCLTKAPGAKIKMGSQVG